MTRLFVIHQKRGSWKQFVIRLRCVDVISSSFIHRRISFASSTRLLMMAQPNHVAYDEITHEQQQQQQNKSSSSSSLNRRFERINLNIFCSFLYELLDVEYVNILCFDTMGVRERETPDPIYCSSVMCCTKKQVFLLLTHSLPPPPPQHSNETSPKLDAHFVRRSHKNLI